MTIVIFLVKTITSYKSSEFNLLKRYRRYKNKPKNVTYKVTKVAKR
jgi:hypothetical protein